MLLSCFVCGYFVSRKARYSWKRCGLDFENTSLFHYLCSAIFDRFLNKFHKFTDRIYDVKIKWVTKKVKQLFKIKVQNPCPSYLICEVACSCKESRWGNMKTLKKTQNQQNRWEVLLWGRGVAILLVCVLFICFSDFLNLY